MCKSSPGCGQYKALRVWLKHIHFFIVYLKTFFKSTEFLLRMSFFVPVNGRRQLFDKAKRGAYVGSHNRF
jgi:hypothetical protein